MRRQAIARKRRKPTRTYCSRSYNNRKGLYSPRTIVWIGLFFWFIPSAILCAINYRRLNDRKHEKRWYLYTGLILLIGLVVPRINPDLSLFFYYMGSALFTWVLYFNQLEPFKRWTANGGPVASPYVPIAICLLVPVLIIIVASAFSVILHLNMYEP